MLRMSGVAGLSLLAAARAARLSARVRLYLRECARS